MHIESDLDIVLDDLLKNDNPNNNGGVLQDLLNEWEADSQRQKTLKQTDKAISIIATDK